MKIYYAKVDWMHRFFFFSSPHNIKNEPGTTISRRFRPRLAVAVIQVDLTEMIFRTRDNTTLEEAESELLKENYLVNINLMYII